MTFSPSSRGMQENECMRQEMEHLLHHYGADIVLQGHVHSCAPCAHSLCPGALCPCAPYALVPCALAPFALST